MKAKVTKLEGERVASQSQPYSQPAPQPQAQVQSYHPPKKIGFWERAHDMYRVAHKTQRMYQLIKADDDEGSRRTLRRVLNYSDKYDDELDRYENKYNVKFKRSW
jgi:hypothetical protein